MRDIPAEVHDTVTDTIISLGIPATDVMVTLRVNLDGVPLFWLNNPPAADTISAGHTPLGHVAGNVKFGISTVQTSGLVHGARLVSHG